MLYSFGNRLLSLVSGTDQGQVFLFLFFLEFSTAEFRGEEGKAGLDPV